jgi:4-hydroxybenzoate polyprenyltransferase
MQKLMEIQLDAPTITCMMPPMVRLLRPAHWAKNVFVLAPVVFAQELTDPEAVRSALLAFVAFCLASSAVYIFNDIRDREEDRRHPLKQNRPLAAGTVSLASAWTLMFLLITIALALAVYLGWQFFSVLLTYLVLNQLYSAGLKHVVILDVMIISLGFVLRVLAGGAATGVQISAWIVLCTFFIALFLAFSKRRHELILLADEASEQRPVLSHYSPAFLDQMINVVTASTVVSYAMYAIAPETTEKFHTQHLIYTIPMVLFGIFRYLYLIYQRPSRRNPTEAILSDPAFLVNIFVWGLAVLLIVYRG